MRLSIACMNEVHGYLESHAELFYKEGGIEIMETAGGYARIASVVKHIRRNWGTLKCIAALSLYGGQSNRKIITAYC